LRGSLDEGLDPVLRISWDEGWGIKGRAVKRCLTRRDPKVVAVLRGDEKAIAKRHRYVTVVVKLERSRVLCLTDDRRPVCLAHFGRIRKRDALPPSP